MNTNNNFQSFEEYAEQQMLSAIRMKDIKKPVGHATAEDLEKMYQRHKAYVESNPKVFEDYLESIIMSYKDREVEFHKSLVLLDSKTGEVIADDFYVLTKEFYKNKKKEYSKYKYLRDKINKNAPKSGIKVSGYKPNHRFTKVFTSARPQFKSHKNLGIFYDITRELSPYENVVSALKNDGTFSPLSTKEIQAKLNISSDDMKRFKSEAKKLNVIADIKLGGRTVGIRVNPAFAINGQSFSNDVFEAFKDSTEFIDSIPEND